MPVVRHQLADPAGTPFVVLAEAERRHRETIARFVKRQNWHFLALPTVCLVNGAPVPIKEWAHRKLRKRDEVVFLSRPGRGGLGGGSGGSSAKSIIAVVGLIALTAIAPWAAGLAFGAGTTAANIGAALLVAGGSMLLTRFLTPKAGGQSDKKDDLYSISAGSNQARPLQPIPVGYGRRLAYPDLAAPSYSEYQGNDQYLYQLFALGCGKYDLEEIRIDDTPLWTKAGGLNPSFPNVQLQYCGPGEQVTLFPVNVVSASEVSGQDVKPQNAWIGGFVANAAGTVAREIILDFVWPGGNFDSYQNRLYPVPTQIEAQAAPVDDAGAQIGDCFGILNKTYNYAKNSQIRVTERVGVPPGRYMVRVRTTTPVFQGDPNPYNGGKSTVTNAFNWAALRATIDGPQSFPGVTTLAIRMKADAVLSGLSSRKIGTIATRILPVWTGTAWAEQATRNPAWAADPTTRPDGTPIQEGDQYVRTTAPKGLRVYLDGAWTVAVMDANGALVAANNLSDLPEKEAARANLGGFTDSNIAVPATPADGIDIAKTRYKYPSSKAVSRFASDELTDLKLNVQRFKTASQTDYTQAFVDCWTECAGTGRDFFMPPGVYYIEAPLEFLTTFTGGADTRRLGIIGSGSGSSLISWQGGSNTGALLKWGSELNTGTEGEVHSWCRLSGFGLDGAAKHIANGLHTFRQAWFTVDDVRIMDFSSDGLAAESTISWSSRGLRVYGCGTGIDLFRGSDPLAFATPNAITLVDFTLVNNGFAGLLAGQRAAQSHRRLCRGKRQRIQLGGRYPGSQKRERRYRACCAQCARHVFREQHGDG